MTLNRALDNIKFINRDGIYLEVSVYCKKKRYTALLEDYREISEFENCELAEPIKIEALRSDLFIHVCYQLDSDTLSALSKTTLWEDFEEWLQKE